MADLESAPPPQYVPEWLRKWSAIAWAFVGVALASIAIFLSFDFLSWIIVPTVFALILATLLLPLTDWLARHIPRGYAVAVILLLCFGIGILLVLIFVKGIVEEAPQIQAGLQNAEAQVKSAFGISDGSTTTTDVSSYGQYLLGFLSAVVNSAISLFFALFIGTMVFFLVLLAPQESKGWFSALAPWASAQSDRFMGTFASIIRDYYKGATILACVNAFPIWLTALALGIPGSGTIFVVMFVTSYIPYVGAWIGGAFAVVLAYGFGGVADAAIMLIAVLVVNLGLQSIIQPFAYGATMRLSALGVFLATLLGSALAGVFGAMMAAPILALFVRYDSDIKLPTAVGDEGAAVSDSDPPATAIQVSEAAS